MSSRTELHINRSSIGQTMLVTTELPPLADGMIRLEVEHFALTANNVTYAQFGDMLDYWGFFPVSAEWGLVPAMGWARIAESTVAGLEVGSRFYGWYPMSTSVDIAPTVASTGFRDDGAHRTNHAAVYRSFLRTDLDGLYTTADDEHRQELLRGLFMTGFLIEQFFAHEKYFGATQAIVLSASSKTALGYATCAKAGGGVRLVGVTSASNRDFVESVSLYDQVVTYGELEQIGLLPSVLVDMAGAGDAVAAIHARLGDDIAHSMVVGKSHHDSAPAMVPAGPRPVMFFAPTSMDSSLASWGPAEYAQRTRAGLTDFLDASRQWLTVEQHNGAAAAEAAWHSLHRGAFEPSVGVVASLH